MPPVRNARARVRWYTRFKTATAKKTARIATTMPAMAPDDSFGAVEAALELGWDTVADATVAVAPPF